MHIVVTEECPFLLVVASTSDVSPNTVQSFLWSNLCVLSVQVELFLWSNLCVLSRWNSFYGVTCVFCLQAELFLWRNLCVLSVQVELFLWSNLCFLSRWNSFYGVTCVFCLFR